MAISERQSHRVVAHIFLARVTDHQILLRPISERGYKSGVSKVTLYPNVSLIVLQGIAKAWHLHEESIASYYGDLRSQLLQEFWLDKTTMEACLLNLEHTQVKR